MVERNSLLQVILEIGRYNQLAQDVSNLRNRASGTIDAKETRKAKQEKRDKIRNEFLKLQQK